MHAPPTPPPEDSRCERCADPDTKCLDGRWLCLECYHLGASCCYSFDDTDRWDAKPAAPDATSTEA